MKTQIDLYNIKIPEIVKYLGWIILILVLWFKGCSNPDTKPELVKVEIPEKKGKFEPKKPTTIPLVSTPFFIKGETVIKTNPLNQKLLSENEILKEKFKKSDSINKKLLFENSIKINSFSSKFDDENVTINIDGIVRGEVQEITPNYVIKKQKIEVQVKPKETVFRLLGGIEIGNNSSFNNFNTKANIFFQNRRGNQISISADNKENYYIGYSFSILNFKK